MPKKIGDGVGKLKKHLRRKEKNLKPDRKK